MVLTLSLIITESVESIAVLFISLMSSGLSALDSRDLKRLVLLCSGLLNDMFVFSIKLENP